MNFPRSGVLASTNVFASRRDLGARDNYTRWDLLAQVQLALGDNTFAVTLRGAGTFDTSCRPTTWSSGAGSCASRAIPSIP